MEPSIYRYILQHSKRDQIYLILLTAASMPLVYVLLDIPKMIVNQALEGSDFPKSFLGVELEQVPFLMALSVAYLGLVIINGGFKYVINVYRGVLGERMLRRFRYELYSRVLRFPLPSFKRVSQGEIIPMITAEAEPLGGFIGDAFALPAFQGGILFTYLFFIFNQDILLGLAATALYPLQIYVIPKLQRKVNALGKQRVQTVRRVADRIGETVSGITEIHAHDTSLFERADIADKLGRIFEIRFEIYRRKFFIKFLNNFLNSVTPFFFYSVGGYYVISGDISLGALVAVLAAYKDLSGPWNELLKYYQIKEDVRVKYGQIIEQFQIPEMLDPAVLDGEPEDVGTLGGELSVQNVSLREDDFVDILEGINLRLDLGQPIAVVGSSNSGKDDLGRLLAGLVNPSSGRIEIGGRDLAALPKAVTGRRLAYAGPSAFVFAGTVRDNLLYGLKHRPHNENSNEGEDAAKRARAIREAEASGNTVHDVHADWVDYDVLGTREDDALVSKIVEALRLVELEQDIYSLGIRSRIDPSAHGDLAEKVLAARALLRQKLTDEDSTELVEPFDENAYNSNASVAENLLFGTARDGGLEIEGLTRHPHTLEVLRKAKLLDDLVEVGQKVAETMVDLFADLPPGHEFFEQYSFISADDLPDYQTLLTRIDKVGLDRIEQEERDRLLSLAMKLEASRHRLGLIDAEMESRILEARRLFAETLPPDLADRIEFFSSEKYNAAATLQDNVLFGKIAYGQAQAQARVGEMIIEVVDALGMRRRVIRVGLDFEVGTAGGRLSMSQRQKLAIARNLLKNPDIMVVNQATSGFDSSTEQKILQNVIRLMKGKGLIWILGRAPLAKNFPYVVVMDGGTVVDHGPLEKIQDQSKLYAELVQSQ